MKSSSLKHTAAKITLAILVVGVLAVSTAPAQVPPPVNVDFKALVQRAAIWGKKALEWKGKLDILRDAADVRDAIRDAAEETQGIVEDHRQMYDDALQGVGFLLDADPNRDRLRRFGDILDNPAADQGLTFRRPQDMAGAFRMGQSISISEGKQNGKIRSPLSYHQETTTQAAATVANTLGTLSEYYAEMEDLDEQLQMLEQEFASARTPEARRDIQINLQILQARHQLLGGLVETARLNMNGVMALQGIDRKATRDASRQASRASVGALIDNLERLRAEQESRN